MSCIKLAIIGAGKVAQDYHVPAIATHKAFHLLACASTHGSLHGVQHFESIGDLLEAASTIDAVAICTPPQVRYAIAQRCLERGLHVFLEKPPAATLGQVEALVAQARRHNVALFAAWHSFEAGGLQPAREWLAKRKIRSIDLRWKEDVRVWHRGQEWIWKPGGLGVFDPGINAL